MPSERVVLSADNFTTIIKMEFGAVQVQRHHTCWTVALVVALGSVLQWKFVEDLRWMVADPSWNDLLADL